jgi:hypothetical protein
LPEGDAVDILTTCAAPDNNASVKDLISAVGAYSAIGVLFTDIEKDYHDDPENNIKVIVRSVSRVLAERALAKQRLRAHGIPFNKNKSKDEDQIGHLLLENRLIKSHGTPDEKVTDEAHRLASTSSIFESVLSLYLLLDNGAIVQTDADKVYVRDQIIDLLIDDIRSDTVTVSDHSTVIDPRHIEALLEAA